MLKLASENDQSLNQRSLGESDTITEQNDNNNSMVVSEIAYTSGEVVNFESSINIDGSTDVIIGPVTQFHVNAGGNLTILQNRKINDKKVRDQHTLEDGKKIQYLTQ